VAYRSASESGGVTLATLSTAHPPLAPVSESGRELFALPRGAGVTDAQPVRGWHRAAAGSTAAVGVLAILGGPALTMYPVHWPAVAFAAAVAVIAQFGALRFRQGTRTIMFAWGESALIVVVYLVPAGWVPLLIGVGFLIGHQLYLLRTGGTWRRTWWSNVTNLAIAGAAGAAVAHAVRLADRAAITPRLIGALLLGGIAYSLVSAALVTLSLHVWGIGSTPYVQCTLRTLADKLPMTAGNITTGIAIVVLLARERVGLLLVAPIVVLMHQAWVYRSRTVEERRLWRNFAEIARTLNQHDEPSVAAAAIRGTISLFRADVVEVGVTDRRGAARRYRGRAGRSPRDIDVVSAADAESPRTSPAAARTLAIDDDHGGDLRLWMPVGYSLDSRDQLVLSAVADALGAALHDALAHDALRKLTRQKASNTHRDVLTGLPNRASLLSDGVSRLAAVGATPVGLLLVGINRFKEVNDTLGPTAGDELLTIMGRRLTAAVPPHDLIARIGGDEFAVLCVLGSARPAPVTSTDTSPETDPSVRPADLLAVATDRAASLAAELTGPTDLAGLQIAVEVSVGVAVAPANDLDLAELVRRAGIAMRRAKRGGGAVAIFEAADTPPGGIDRLSVLVDLREALARDDQLVLAIQPTVDLATGEPIAAEALIRWRHPRRGPLTPRDFVDLIDQSDLVMPFTRYVLDHALRLADEWSRAGLPIGVSVNLSPRSVAHPDLPGDVIEVLKRYGVEPHRLTLEITESAVATGQPTAVEVLAELRQHGVQLAVDDFGSGYSSLTFLARIQVDEVKVDSVFVAAMTESAEAEAIVRTTIDLGRRLGVRVVAEGVETPLQRTALTELGCTAAQGWHIAPPVDADAALDVIRVLADAADGSR
jgi:diguanylate cyclase